MNNKTKWIVYGSGGLMLTALIVSAVKGKKSKPSIGDTDDVDVYAEKVKTLQAAIGANVDGDAGTETNTKTKAAFPNLYARWGRVSPLNIDMYLEGEKNEATLKAGGVVTPVGIESKVRELQRLLKMPAVLQTGYAGPVTHSTLQKKLPDYYKRYGNVTIANIDPYLIAARKLTTTFG